MLESAFAFGFLKQSSQIHWLFEALELLFTVAVSAEAADVTAVLLPAVADALPLLVTAALSPQPKEIAATEHNSTKLHKSVILRLELVFNISMASLKFSIVNVRQAIVEPRYGLGFLLFTVGFCTHFFEILKVFLQIRSFAEQKKMQKNTNSATCHLEKNY